MHAAAGCEADAAASRVALRDLGVVPYAAAYDAMRRHTAGRDAGTADELWLVQHPPVYTLGAAARRQLASGYEHIPVVDTDRGGEMTYHGPGQPIVYALVDLARRELKVGAMVRLLEQAAIDLLAAHGVLAARRRGAPGVYVAGAKIAALGLRVRQGRCYHGIALNADMDLAPFSAIDPCGYPGLAVTQAAAVGIAAAPGELGLQLARRIAGLLERSP